MRQTRGLTQKKVNRQTLDALDRLKSNEMIHRYQLLWPASSPDPDGPSRAVNMVSFTEPHGTLF